MTDAGRGRRTTPGAPLSEGERPMVIAQYLPQFHPVPENDAFWGRGFTEWRNVVTAQPRYPDHHQPRLPGDLGFYDLRLPETRDAQAEMARMHGVDGFAYYHYWLGGRRVLERPFAEVLDSGRPDLPFCLLWANHDWDGMWNGRDDQVFIRQHHSAADDAAHVAFLVRAFADPRYLRVEGRPLFLVYRLQALPDPHRFVELLGRGCADAGLPPPFVVRSETYGSFDDPGTLGADASADYFPHVPPEWAERARVDGLGRPGDMFWDYDSIRASFRDRPPVGWTRYPQVVPDWDNTARRPTTPALALVGSTPDAYGDWLEEALRQQIHAEPPGRRVVFVNAWNEWAEAAYLEPDLRHGRAYLAATAAAVSRVTGRPLPATEGEAGPSHWAATLEQRHQVLVDKYTALCGEHATHLTRARIARDQLPVGFRDQVPDGDPGPLIDERERRFDIPGRLLGRVVRAARTPRRSVERFIGAVRHRASRHGR